LVTDCCEAVSSTGVTCEAYTCGQGYHAPLFNGRIIIEDATPADEGGSLLAPGTVTDSPPTKGGSTVDTNPIVIGGGLTIGDGPTIGDITIVGDATIEDPTKDGPLLAPVTVIDSPVVKEEPIVKYEPIVIDGGLTITKPVFFEPVIKVGTTTKIKSGTTFIGSRRLLTAAEDEACCVANEKCAMFEGCAVVGSITPRTRLLNHSLSFLILLSFLTR
jgi:hypothetical protein